MISTPIIAFESKLVNIEDDKTEIRLKMNTKVDKIIRKCVKNGIPITITITGIDKEGK